MIPLCSQCTRQGADRLEIPNKTMKFTDTERTVLPCHVKKCAPAGYRNALSATSTTVSWALTTERISLSPCPKTYYSSAQDLRCAIPIDKALEDLAPLSIKSVTEYPETPSKDFRAKKDYSLGVPAEAFLDPRIERKSNVEVYSVAESSKGETSLSRLYPSSPVPSLPTHKSSTDTPKGEMSLTAGDKTPSTTRHNGAVLLTPEPTRSRCSRYRKEDSRSATAQRPQHRNAATSSPVFRLSSKEKQQLLQFPTKKPHSSGLLNSTEPRAKSRKEENNKLHLCPSLLRTSASLNALNALVVADDDDDEDDASGATKLQNCSNLTAQSVAQPTDNAAERSKMLRDQVLPSTSAESGRNLELYTVITHVLRRHCRDRQRAVRALAQFLLSRSDSNASGIPSSPRVDSGNNVHLRKTSCGTQTSFSSKQLSEETYKGRLGALDPASVLQLDDTSFDEPLDLSNRKPFADAARSSSALSLNSPTRDNTFSTWDVSNRLLRSSPNVSDPSSAAFTSKLNQENQRLRCRLKQAKERCRASTFKYRLALRAFDRAISLLLHLKAAEVSRDEAQDITLVFLRHLATVRDKLPFADKYLAIEWLHHLVALEQLLRSPSSLDQLDTPSSCRVANRNEVQLSATAGGNRQRKRFETYCQEKAAVEETQFASASAEAPLSHSGSSFKNVVSNSSSGSSHRFCGNTSCSTSHETAARYERHTYEPSETHRSLLTSTETYPWSFNESFAASTRNTDQPSCPVVSYKSEVNRFAQEKGDYTPISKFALAQKQSKKYSTQSDTQLLSMPDAPQCQQFRYSTGDCTKKSAASRRVPLLGLSNAGAGSWLSGWQTSGETYPSYDENKRGFVTKTESKT